MKNILLILWLRLYLSLFSVRFKLNVRKFFFITLLSGQVVFPLLSWTDGYAANEDQIDKVQLYSFILPEKILNITKCVRDINNILIKAGIKERGDDFITGNVKFGAPREVIIKKNLTAYEIPLIAEDYSARFLYLSNDLRLLQPPLENENKGRFFLTLKEWDETKNMVQDIPEDYFESYPAGFQNSYFPYTFTEKIQNLYKINGAAISTAKLKDFKILKNLNALPEKKINEVSLNSSGETERNLKYNSDDSKNVFKVFPLKSGSYAAAFCADWWQISSSNSNEVIFEKYYDLSAKKNAFGTNPRVLDRLYQLKSSDNADVFSFSQYLKDHGFFSEKVSDSIEGFASILVLPEETFVADAVAPQKGYKINEINKFYMDDDYIKLFENYDGKDEDLVSALDMYGIVLGGMTFYMNGMPLKGSSYGVAIVGCRHIGENIFFVYKDFEDERDIYRVAPVQLFKEAYCFPHEFSGKAKYIVKQRKLVIETFDKNGNHIDVNSIEATFPNEDIKVKFYKESTGYYFHQVKKEDFKGIERATLNAKIKKNYYVKGDKQEVIIKYAIY